MIQSAQQGEPPTLIELLHEDAVVGELQQPDVAIRRALNRLREVDGGSEGEEPSPETATAGELLNLTRTSDCYYQSKKNLMAEHVRWMQMDQRGN